MAQRELRAGFFDIAIVGNPPYQLNNMLALLYNFTSVTRIQIFSLVGEMSRKRFSPSKREYLYIDEYLYSKILVS